VGNEGTVASERHHIGRKKDEGPTTWWIQEYRKEARLRSKGHRKGKKRNHGCKEDEMMGGFFRS